MSWEGTTCLTENVPDVTVLLAVNDQLQQALLRRALRRRSDIAVVGAEQDGCQALEAVVRLAPDVAVVDAGLPTIDGLELCRRLAGSPQGATRVLLLEGDPPVSRALAVQAGAAGCLPVTATTAQICDAVASIANGGTIFHD
jgi:DNA-binding NarL/FixJ family response regulator